MRIPNRYAVIAFIVLLVIALILFLQGQKRAPITPSTSKIPGTTSGKPTEQVKKARQEGKIGEAIQSGDLALTVNSAHFITHAEDASMPESEMMLWVNVILQNKGKGDYNLDAMNIQVIDSNGRPYTAKIAKDDGQLQSQALGAGQSMTGKLGYKLYVEGMTYQLYFSPSGNSTEILVGLSQ